MGDVEDDPVEGEVPEVPEDEAPVPAAAERRAGLQRRNAVMQQL